MSRVTLQICVSSWVALVATAAIVLVAGAFLHHPSAPAVAGFIADAVKVLGVTWGAAVVLTAPVTRVLERAWLGLALNFGGPVSWGLLNSLMSLLYGAGAATGT